MAGFRKNIDPEIKIGLDERVNAMSRYGDTVLRSSALSSTDDSQSPYNLTREDQIIKTPFVRLISPGTISTQVLYGMFNIDNLGAVDGTGEGTDVFASRAQDLEGGVENNQYGNQRTIGEGENASNNPNYLKPKAGITSVSIVYQKFGGAVRKATINWTCFTLEQLAMYQQGSFLSAGRSVVLDWGWVRNSNITTIPKILITDGSSVKFDSKLFESKKNNNGDIENIELWNTLYRRQYGDWSGLIGTVSGFNWDMRDDGGFDCTTEVLAKGTNIFQEPIKPIKSEMPNPTETIPLGLPSMNDFLKKMVDASGVGDSETIAKLLKASGPELNINERLNVLDLEILIKYFEDRFDEVKEKPIAVTSDDNCIVAILSPTSEGLTGLTKEGLFQDPFETTNTAKKTRAKDYSGDMWIQWGWFEDNIVSYYASNIIDERGNPENKKRAAQFRSIQPYTSTTTTITSPPSESTNPPGMGMDSSGNAIQHTPGQRMEKFKIPEPEVIVNEGTMYRSNTVQNDPELFTYDPSIFILPGQFPSNWCQHEKEEGDTVELSPYGLVATEFESTGIPAFAVDEKKEKGYLRHIFVNVSHIKKIFSRPGQSIESAMLSLAKSLNSKINIWEFQLESSSGEEIPSDATLNAMIVEAGTENSKTDGGDEGTGEDISDPKKSYIFENYGMNSLVQQLSLSSTLPDKFAMQAGFGSQRMESDNENEDPIRDYILKRPNTPKDNNAEKLGEFFSDPNNASLIKTYQRTPSNIQFGANKDQAVDDVKELDDEGLSNSKFNHDVPDSLMEITPGVMSKSSLLEKFSQKYKDSILSSFSGSFAVPDSNDPGSKDMIVELRKPYNLSGKLRPHFMSRMKWFFEDSPLTKKTGNTKTLTLPLSLDMTIEGCGGLFPGHMFRLAYLPKSYGQTELDESKTPKTYFTVSGIQHDISESGWTTKIQGLLNKNTEAIEDEAISGLSKEKRKEKMEAIRTAYKEQLAEFKDPTV